MSIKTISKIFQHYPGSGARMLVLIALADFGNDDGGSIYPSLDTLAKRCHCSRAQVQRHVRALRAEGFIRAIANASGGAGRTVHYEIAVERLSEPDGGKKGIESDAVNTEERASLLNKKGITFEQKGHQICTKRAAEVMPDQLLTVSEPKTNHQRREKDSSTAPPEVLEFSQWHLSIASEFSLDVAEEWRRFRDHCRTNGTRSQDWNLGFWAWLNQAGQDKLAALNGAAPTQAEVLPQQAYAELHVRP